MLGGDDGYSKRPGTEALALLLARSGSPPAELTVADSVLRSGSGSTARRREHEPRGHQVGTTGSFGGEGGS